MWDWGMDRAGVVEAEERGLDGWSRVCNCLFTRLHFEVSNSTLFTYHEGNRYKERIRGCLFDKFQKDGIEVIRWGR